MWTFCVVEIQTCGGRLCAKFAHCVNDQCMCKPGYYGEGCTECKGKTSLGGCILNVKAKVAEMDAQNVKVKIAERGVHWM